MFNIRRMEVCRFSWRLTPHDVDRHWIILTPCGMLWPLRARQPKDLIDIQKCNQYNLPENYPMAFCEFPFCPISGMPSVDRYSFSFDSIFTCLLMLYKNTDHVTS